MFPIIYRIHCYLVKAYLQYFNYIVHIVFKYFANGTLSVDFCLLKFFICLLGLKAKFTSYNVWR